MFVIAISLALAVIPVPPTTSIVNAPAVPPPVKPAPAVTPVISPTWSASIVSVPAASSYVAVMFAPPTINAATLSSTRSFVKNKFVPSVIWSVVPGILNCPVPLV